MDTALKIAPHIKYALIVLCVVLVIILLSKWTGSGSGCSGGLLLGAAQKGVKHMMHEAQTDHDTNGNSIAEAMSLTSRLANLHAAKSLASEKDIEKLTGVNVQELEEELKARRNFAMSGMK